MGSVLSTGYYREQAAAIEAEKCPKSKVASGEHTWQVHGSWPSQWKECTGCGVCVYSK